MATFLVSSVSACLVLIAAFGWSARGQATLSPQEVWSDVCRSTFLTFSEEYSQQFDEDDYRCLCDEHCSDRFITAQELPEYVHAYENLYQFEYPPGDRDLLTRCLEGIYAQFHNSYNLTAWDYKGICLELYPDPYGSEITNATNAILNAVEDDRTSFMIPIFTALIAIAFVLGVIGNVLMIITMYFLAVRKLASVIDLLIGNLAIIDLVVVCVCLPMQLLNTYSWDLETIDKNFDLCRVFVQIFYASFFVSILMLVAMAFERLVEVKRPMTSLNTLSRSKKYLAVFGIVLLVWVFGYLMAAPIHMILQNYNCGYFWLGPDVKEVFVYYLVAGYAIPVLIFIGIYGHIICVLAKSYQKDNKSSGSAAKANRAKVKTIGMLVTVTVVFILVWGPQMIGNVYYAYNYEYIVQYGDFGRMDSSQFRPLIQLISIYGSVFNPYIYLAFSSRYRRCFAYILCCGRAGTSIEKAAKEDASVEQTKVDSY